MARDKQNKTKQKPKQKMKKHKEKKQRGEWNSKAVYFACVCFYFDHKIGILTQAPWIDNEP